MAGRQMLFTKKGDASKDAPKGAPDTGSDNNEPPESNEEAGEMVTCPECGCQFDPDMAAEHGESDDAKGDGKGVALEIPAPAGDAQAPVGEDAITRAIAAVMAQQGGR